jgi:hypothetical protein
MVFGQGSETSSLSSSDESDLEDRAQGGKKKQSKLEKGVSAAEDPNGALRGAFGRDRTKPRGHKHQMRHKAHGAEHAEKNEDTPAGRDAEGAINEKV